MNVFVQITELKKQLLYVNNVLETKALQPWERNEYNQLKTAYDHDIAVIANHIKTHTIALN